MAHARLLEAISPKRNRQSAHRTPPSQQLRRVFYFPERGHSKFLRRSRNGRPGSLGSRRHARARSAGPAGGNEAQAGYRWQSEPGKGSLWRRAVESAATEFVSQFWFAASCGSTNAGGEDFGYFAPREKRVRIPPLTPRTVEAASRGPLRRGPRFFREEAPGLVSLRPRLPVPRRAFSIAGAQRCASAWRW